VISSLSFPRSVGEQSEVGMTTPFIIEDKVGFLNSKIIVRLQSEVQDYIFYIS